MIEIDPNQRVAGNHGWTFASYEEVRGYEVGDAIVVYESESHLAWPAKIIALRLHESAQWYVEFDVAWRKGKAMPGPRRRPVEYPTRLPSP